MVRTWYMYTELARTHSVGISPVSHWPVTAHTHWRWSLRRRDACMHARHAPHVDAHTIAQGRVSTRRSFRSGGGQGEQGIILPLGLCAASWPGTEAPPSSVDNGGVGTLA